MELQQKILDAFTGKVVRKDLAFTVKGNLPVPTYVLEYLLGQYCATDDEQLIAEGIEKVKTVIKNNYVHRAEADIIKGRIREAGTYRVIDKVNVVLNDKANVYEATFANLGLTKVPVQDSIVTQNPKLLSGNGVWCIVTLLFDASDEAVNRWNIERLKPIQISGIDLNEYISQRAKFTTEEWIDFMIHTVGLDPELLNEREKIIVLARLLPFVENNFNFMELGPKGTGKSHVFQELSPYGVLVSGGDITSARLFVKMSGNKELLGLVGYWDCVAWDEYEHQKGKSVDSVMIDTMQNYLANKSFNRGKGSHEASASMAFVGNTKHTVEYMLRNTHLFESIPEAFIKGAFLDRIHLYNPGWEIKMLKKASFSKGYGLITDYIAAVLHELRNQDYSAEINKYVLFDSSLSERDHLAIRKTFSGMVKLLFPDGRMTHEEAMKLIEFAAEARKRVKDQLYVIDETFRAEPAKFVYLVKNTGEEKSVETLERLNCALPEIEAFVPFEEQIGVTKESVESPSVVSDNGEKREKRSRIHTLIEKSLSIRLGQTGVSYKSLFASYLQTANEITIEDPYIRAFWQIKNLTEFLAMLIETRSVEGLKVNLITSEAEDKIPALIDDLDDIKDEMATLGIEFKYQFQDFHDRCITTDTGWKISLGRGLDIFEPFSKYSIGAMQQERRKCKEFTVIYMNENQQEPENKTTYSCISVKQPWATLLCTIKNVENRTWDTKKRGRILIHASAKPEPGDPWDYFTDEEAASVRVAMNKGIIPDPKNFPTGCIVGYGDLIDCVEGSDSIWANPDCINWIFENRYLFKNPIPNIKGKLGFFNYDGELPE